MKFGYNRPSGFTGEIVYNCGRRTDGPRRKRFVIVVFILRPR